MEWKQGLLHLKLSENIMTFKNIFQQAFLSEFSSKNPFGSNDSQYVTRPAGEGVWVVVIWCGCWGYC